MRNRIIFVIVVGALATGFILWRQKRSVRVEAARDPVETKKVDTLAPPPPPSAHVRKLSKEDRAKLAEQIHASLAQRVSASSASAPTAAPGSAGANAAPSLDEPLLEIKDIGPELKTALDESISILADCYDQHPGNTVVGSGSDQARTALALMVMTSDPDLGTIVDSDKLTDADGTPLDAAIEGCLRDTIESLALPPLGKPGKLPLQYSFRFDDEKK